MFRSASLTRTLPACASFVVLFFSTTVAAEQFWSTPVHEVGPAKSAQATPAPGAGWQTSDDRMLGASVNGQGGWQTVAFSTRYDEEIANGVAHIGGHSWRVSNWFHTGVVNPILSPSFGSVGENASNHVVYEFWFRSASALPDPGNAVSTTISDAPGNRMTYLGMFDETPGPGTGGDDGNGCPTDNGCFHVDAIDVTSGNDVANDGDATFKDHYSQPLQRGVWYRARIDATFVPGIGGKNASDCPSDPPPADDCDTGNDQIHYQVFDGNGHVVFDQTIGSWEAAYFDGRYTNPKGTVTSSNYVAFRVSSNADNGTQQPFDTNSVALQPLGVYIDDLSVTPDSGASMKTSFDFDRYVATTGSDTTDCSVQTNPCLTIAYAITQSNPYDTVHVAPGRYPERSSSTSNLTITKPVAIVGAQAGVDARTRDVGGGSDANETIIVPGVHEAGVSLSSYASAVININSDGVSLDGLVIDGDNPLDGSGVSLNGANVDVSNGVFATGNDITLQNTVFRNFIYTGIDGDTSTPQGGNLIAHNRFTNITSPAAWGRGIIVEDNWYAQISDNLMDEVRVGIQTNNNFAAAPNGFVPSIVRNEIHATRTGIFHNLFSGSASAYTIADNLLIASNNATQTGLWSGVWVESMTDAQTVTIENNTIDANALAGSGRERVGYLLNNILSSAASATAIDSGSVTNVDVGVMSTDATYYTGPVNDFAITGVHFDHVTLGAFYVEDAVEQTGSASLTIGDGNQYTDTKHVLVLSGSGAAAHFGGAQTGASDVFVRAKGAYAYGAPGSSDGPCLNGCTVANASINAGVDAAAVNGVVSIENGTFDETVVIGTGKDGVRLTAADTANAPTLTRSSGGSNQPLVVIAATPYNVPSTPPGAAPTRVQIDHLNLVVDKVFSGEGILASGFVDGLIVDSNTITQIASSTSASSGYSLTNGVSVNLDPAHNSLGLPRVNGSQVTISNNVIAGSASPNATQFRAAIAVDASVGSIVGNQASGLNHDAIVRFATTVSGGANGWSVSGNTFGGGGLEFDAPNAGITPISIDGNTIAAEAVAPAKLAAVMNVSQTAAEADFSAMRLIDNQQNLPVTVSNNIISGYADGFRGALVENFPNVSFVGNTFTPASGASDFVSLVVSNKEINTDNPPEAPYPMSFTAMRNTFNGSGTANAGRAVEFIDDNDANGSATFGPIAFGGTQAADANRFDANHALFFNLVNQNCNTRSSPTCSFLDYNGVGSVADTQVRPFRGNVYAVNNVFGTLPTHAMSPTQQSQLNAKTYDINDVAALGLVNYGFTGAVDIALRGPIANVQVGVPTAYSAELTNTGDALTENVLIQFAISRTAGIAASDLTLQYFDGGTYQTIPLHACGVSLCGAFGPPGGFPVAAGYDATTQLHVTYGVADTYTATVLLQGVSSGVTYASDMLSTQVVQSATKLGLSLAGPQTATAGAPTIGYSARLTNTGGAVPENVLVHFVASRNGGVSAGDVTIAYYNGSGYQAIPLTVCGANLCGTFGPQPAGFPIGAGYDQTTSLQVSYAKSGVFTVAATVDGVNTSSTYASASLQVTVGAGSAANIAANSPTSITGTAGTAASPLPSVVVTDAAGNPVSGYAITFVAGPNSGTVSGTSQVTNDAGVATLGGWTLGTAPAQTVSVTTPLSGGTITFTATVSAEFDLAVNITDNRQYEQYGHVINYAIVVSNAGPSSASNTVTDNLPPELDLSSASWVCLAHTSGAICADGGSGNLSDTPTIPAGGSVTYVLSATIAGASPDETIVDQVSVGTTGDSDPSNNTATSTTTIVIFRDGFETGSGGIVTNDDTLGTLDDNATVSLDPRNAPSAGSAPVTWLRGVDAQQREAFRVEVIGGGNGAYVRVVTTDAHAIERPTPWTPLNSAALGVAGKNGDYEAMLVTGSTSLQVVLPSWAALPITVHSVD